MKSEEEETNLSRKSVVNKELRNREVGRKGVEERGRERERCFVFSSR